MQNAIDLAITLGVQQPKGIVSKVAGDADILLVPDLKAGNMLANQLSFLARILKVCAWLGAMIDAESNHTGGPCISTVDSDVAAWVSPTNEELMIARHTRACVSGGGAGDAH